MGNRLDRALRILKFLQSNKSYDPGSLAVALGVNRRTVYRDIAFLREMGIGIEFAADDGQYVIRDQPGPRGFGGHLGLRKAFQQATDLANHDASVESIIREIARYLANPSADDAQASERSDAGLSQADAQINSAAAKSTLASADAPASPTRNTRNEPGVRWLITCKSLDVLRQAVVEATMIETCEANVESAVSDRLRTGTPRTFLIRPVEFAVSARSVSVMGVGVGGKLIHTNSVCFRFIESVVDSPAAVDHPLELP